MPFRTSHHRLIFVPLFLFAAFLSLFFVTEPRRALFHDSIRKIVNTPISEQIVKLQEELFEMAGATDAYYFSGKTRAQARAEIFRSFEGALREEAALSGSLYKTALDAKEDLHQADLFASMREQMEKVKAILSKAEKGLSDEEWRGLKGDIEKLLHKAQNLRSYVEATHREAANHLLVEMSDYEEQRILFVNFLLLSGLLLVLSLLYNMCRYKGNAKRAEAAEQYNAIFAAALQSTRVGVLIRDMRKDGAPIIFVNAAFTRMTGYALDDVKNEPAEFLFGWKTDPGTMTAFRRALSLQETAVFDFLIYRKDGSPFWSEWHLNPLVDEKGALTHFVSLFTDTTAIRETQEDLIQAKKLAQHASAVKTNFLAMMSHEVRTPINGILGVLRLVEETALDNEQKHLIGIAKTSSRALHGIINDILDYAKMEAGKIELFNEVFSLPELLDNIVGLFQTVAEEKGVELSLELSPDLPELFLSDPGRMRQIVLNLVSNAIKFTDKGFVRLRVFSLMEQDVEGRPGFLLRFEVQDTGIGISPADQEKLFKEFSQIERSFTRRFGGTGLGLAISRRLVGLFGGEIGVESQPGKGSRFWFMIPIGIAEKGIVLEEDANLDSSASNDPTRVYHILLVEDNETNRLVARRYLEKAGFLVEEAINGLEAIEKAKAADFDLILMDVSMPEMDGMLATCHIRALGGHNAQVPVIALTAHVMAGDRELCLAAGMNDYLNKPLEYDLLLKALARWLRFNGGERREGGGPEKSAPVATISQIAAWNDHEALDFDSSVLQRMKDDLGKESVAQVTDVFLRDSAERIKAFEATDIETIQNAAHTLKSCSANCGLMRFSKLMAALELASGRGDKGQMAALLPLALGLYEEARAKLVAEREKYTT